MSRFNVKKVAVLAQEMDVPVHIHLHETAEEVEESMQNVTRVSYDDLMWPSSTQPYPQFWE